eukprot:3049647-Prorocentrum_lima.AAC.1
MLNPIALMNPDRDPHRPIYHQAILSCYILIPTTDHALTTYRDLLRMLAYALEVPHYRIQELAEDLLPHVRSVLRYTR